MRKISHQHFIVTVIGWQFPYKAFEMNFRLQTSWARSATLGIQVELVSVSQQISRSASFKIQSRAEFGKGT